MAQHKWHKEIKAWADGAEIEARCEGGEWFYVRSIPFWDAYEYRIKPQPKEPQYLSVWLNKNNGNVELDIGLPDGVLADQFYNYLGKLELKVED